MLLCWLIKKSASVALRFQYVYGKKESEIQLVQIRCQGGMKTCECARLRKDNTGRCSLQRHNLQSFWEDYGTGST